MKIKFLFIGVILLVIFGFFSFSETNNSIINVEGNTIQQRFQPPAGFARVEQGKLTLFFKQKQRIKLIYSCLSK